MLEIDYKINDFKFDIDHIGDIELKPDASCPREFKLPPLEDFTLTVPAPEWLLKMLKETREKYRV